MGNKRLTAKAMQGDKQAVHPGSRKAGQLDRVQLRALKLQKAGSKRKDVSKLKCELSGTFAASDLHLRKMFAAVSRPIYFHSLITSPEPLTLPQLRGLITDVYLARLDDEVNQLVAERRAGRPKSKDLVDLEEIKRREAAEWVTGFGEILRCGGV